MKINKLFLVLCFGLIFTESRNLNIDDFSALNMSSRFTALGTISLNYFPNHSRYKNINSKFRLHNSSIYDDLIKVNNIFYTKKINNKWIFKNKIEMISITFINRKIENIENTNQIWNDEINPPSSPSDLDYGLITYFNHNDFQLLVDFFIKRKKHRYGIHLFPTFSKTENVTSKSFSIDLSYAFNFKTFFFGMIFRDILSHKVWSTNKIEKFYPSISILMNKQFKKLNYFIELDNFFAEKYKFQKIKVKHGFEYNFLKDNFFRVGFYEDNNSIGFGSKIYEKMVIDYSYSNHIYLGNTNQFTFQFILN